MSEINSGFSLIRSHFQVVVGAEENTLRRRGRRGTVQRSRRQWRRKIGKWPKVKRTRSAPDWSKRWRGRCTEESTLVGSSLVWENRWSFFTKRAKRQFSYNLASSDLALPLEPLQVEVQAVGHCSPDQKEPDELTRTSCLTGWPSRPSSGRGTKRQRRPT